MYRITEIGSYDLPTQTQPENSPKRVSLLPKSTFSLDRHIDNYLNLLILAHRILPGGLRWYDEDEIGHVPGEEGWYDQFADLRVETEERFLHIGSLGAYTCTLTGIPLTIEAAEFADSPTILSHYKALRDRYQRITRKIAEVEREDRDNLIHLGLLLTR